MSFFSNIGNNILKAAANTVNSKLPNKKNYQEQNKSLLNDDKQENDTFISSTKKDEEIFFLDDNKFNAINMLNTLNLLNNPRFNLFKTPNHIGLKTTPIYDNNGNIIGKTEELSTYDKNGEILNGKILKYDSNNKLTEEKITIYPYVNDQNVSKVEKTNYYNSDGLTHTTTKKYDKKNILLSEGTKYYYTNDTAIEYITEYTYENSEIITYTETTQNYDKNDNIIQKNDVFYDKNDNLIRTNSVSYLYHDNGALKKQTASITNEYGIEEIFLQEEYDEYSRKIKDTSKYWENYDIITKTTKYTYKSNGINKNEIPKVPSYVTQYILSTDIYNSTNYSIKKTVLNDNLELTNDELISKLDEKEGKIVNLSNENFNYYCLAMTTKLSYSQNNKKALAYYEKIEDLQRYYNYCTDEKQRKKYLEQLEDLNIKMNEELFKSEVDISFTKDVLNMIDSYKFYEENSEQIMQNMKIRDDFNPKTMVAYTYGEMLLSQLYDVKDKYEAYGDQMGTLDTIISYCNIFGFGTSQYEIEEMFVEYEKAIRNFSNYENIMLVPTFKALSGYDLTNENLQNFALIEMFTYNIDNATNEQLINIANKYNIPLENAYIKKEVSYQMVGDSNSIQIPIVEYENVLSYACLASILKECIKNDICTSQTIIDGFLNNYQDGVISQREFIIEFSRIALTAATGGQSFFVSGGIGLMTETIGVLLNSDATGSQKITMEDALATIVSGFISSGFQQGSKGVLNLLTSKFPGMKTLLGQLKQINLGSNTLEHYFKRFIEITLLKGTASSTLKEATKYLLTNSDETVKLIKNEMTDDEIDEYVTNFVDKVKKGAINGTTAGALLFIYDVLNPVICEKIKNAISNTSQVIKGEISSAYGNIVSSIVTSSGKTSMKSVGKLLSEGEVDWAYIIETEINELNKIAFSTK